LINLDRAVRWHCLDTHGSESRGCLRLWRPNLPRLSASPCRQQVRPNPEPLGDFVNRRASDQRGLSRHAPQPRALPSRSTMNSFCMFPVDFILDGLHFL
jgi:hypothetical protein